MKLDKLKQEMIAVGMITLYFFLWFALFMILKKLILYEHKITFYGWSSAIIGALLIGKVVFIFDKSPISKRIKHSRPIQEIIIKAFAYTLLVFIVTLLEKTIHFWLEDPLLLSWSSALFGSGRGALLLAHTIYIYFCFLGFYFIHFLIKLLGREKLIKLLTEPR
jgi:hypothetical protein